MSRRKDQLKLKIPHDMDIPVQQLHFIYLALSAKMIEEAL